MGYRGRSPREEPGVRSRLRVAGVVILASLGFGWPAAAAEPTTLPDPSTAVSEHPIRDSIDRATEAVVLAHLKPCLRAEHEGVPCFPVSVEEEGPRFSVAEALQRYRGVGSPAPGAPTSSRLPLTSTVESPPNPEPSLTEVP